MVEIITERLRLRPFHADDLPAFVAYRRDPEVARYQYWDPTFSMTDAKRFLASQGRHGSGDIYLVDFGDDLSSNTPPQTIGQIRLYH